MTQGGGALSALRETITAQLPEPLRAHLQNIIVKPGEVVVFTESAAWAARLKIALAEAPLDLAPALVGKHSVTVKVMPTGEFRR